VRAPAAGTALPAVGPGIPTILASGTTERVALDAADWELVDAARAVIRRAYRAGRHAVGAAIHCPSGKVYTGVNVSGSSAYADSEVESHE
jgi:hypothetical protein